MKTSSRFLARVKFYSAKKTAQESVVEWTARLQTLAEPCGFLQERDTVLRDIFAIGLGPGPLRDRLHHEMDADSSVSLVALQQLALEQETAAQRDSEGSKEVAVTIQDELPEEKCVVHLSNKDPAGQDVDNTSNTIETQFNINAEKVEISDNGNQSRELNFPFNLRDKLSTFQGRKREITLLHNSFQLLDRKIIVIYGLCGTGKTELANEYAWEYKKYYKDNIVWIQYENEKQFESMFVDIAKQLDVKYEDWEKPVARVLANCIYSSFVKKGGGLFVFDNVLSRSMLNDYLPNDSCRNIRVLITSPYAKWGNIKTIHLLPLSENETISLFKAVAKDTLNLQELEGVVQLIPKILSGVPLITQRFSIYIANECPRIDKNFSFSQCINQIEIYNILYDKPFPKWSEQNNQKTIYTSLMATLENIQHITENEDVSKMATKIINFCAYCNFDNIPYSLLQSFSQNSSSDDSELTYKLLVAALSILVDMSLILYENGNVHMNKLVRNLVLLHQQKCGTKSAWYSEVLQFILNTSDDYNLLEAYVFNYVEEQKETIFKMYQNNRNQEKLKLLLTKYECQSTLDYIYNHHTKEMNSIKVLKLENNNKQLKAIDDIQIHLSENSADVCATSIHEAADNGHLDIIKLLVSHDESLVYLAENDEHKCIPFHSAAINGHVNILKYFLLDHQVPINLKNDTGNSALHLAALNGRIDAVSFLIDEGAQIDIRNNCGTTVLHTACRSSSVETVKFLIAKGIPVDVRDDEDFTPLHAAAVKGRTENVSLMIDHKADVNATDHENNNALHFSAWNGHATTTKMLLDKGCSPQTENNEGNTPLMDAITQRHLSVVKVFCENGCRPDDASNKNGRTPMSVACSNGCTQICEYFLKQFPDLYKRSNTLPAKKSNENAEP